MSGKGDTYRPVDPQKWASEWERIFLRPDLSGVPSGTTWRLQNPAYGIEAHLRHSPEPDTLPPHTQEGHGESDPAEND